MARSATAGLPCTGSIRMLSSPPTSSLPRRSSAPLCSSRAGRRGRGRSPSAWSRAAAARCRLVDPDGKPLGRYPAAGLLLLVATPGPTFRRNPAKDDPLFANELIVNRLDMVNYPFNFQSDAEGRLALPALIPGASYRVVDRSPVIGGSDPAIRKEFTVKPGEALDLGDIVIAKPRRRE